jgi:4-coumarate--CoA ligase
MPHFALIANVIQIAVHNKVNEDYCEWDDRRYRPGDVAIGGKSLMAYCRAIH